MAETSQRLFISLNPSARVLVELGGIQQTLRTALAHLPLPAVRWIRADQMHLTLHFLGDCLPDRMAAVEMALREFAAGMALPELTLRGLGCFPAFNHPRVIWMGIEENAALKQLHSAFTDVLEARCGISQDRSFYPHLTLARLGKRDGQDRFRLSSELEKIRVPEVMWQPKAISLMRSVQRPPGAAYSCVAQFSPAPLSAPADSSAPDSGA